MSPNASRRINSLLPVTLPLLLFCALSGAGAAHARDTIVPLPHSDSQATPNGIAGYDLLSKDDRVLAFDYDGDGRQDLFLYRPGSGAAWVARSNGDGTFTAVYAVGDNGPAEPNGIAGYDLLSKDDRALAFDYDGDGKQDLLFYRPGSGMVWVARSNGDGTFTAVRAMGSR
jgi:1-phosphatidylinositol phosphodiesterase